jgi:hypothetical protein
MPHLLGFLAGRIAQPHEGLELRARPLRACRGRFHCTFCKIADRLAESTVHILKKNCETRPRPLASTHFSERDGGTARLVVLSLGAEK